MVYHQISIYILLKQEYDHKIGIYILLKHEHNQLMNAMSNYIFHLFNILFY